MKNKVITNKITNFISDKFENDEINNDNLVQIIELKIVNNFFENNCKNIWLFKNNIVSLY